MSALTRRATSWPLHLPARGLALPAAATRTLAGLAAVLLLPVVVTAPVWLPYLHPRIDLWPMDDAGNHLMRLFTIEHLLRQGVLYPRWVPDLFRGFGMPLLNYYAPLLYFLETWVHWLTRAGLYRSMQAVGALAAALGASGTSLLLYRVTRDRAAAIFGAAVYAYSPYPFLTNLYYRAALPEALALALAPWVTVATVEVARPGGRRAPWMALGVVAGSFSFLAHNMLGPLSLVTALGFGAWMALFQPGPASWRARLRQLARPAVMLAAIGGVTAFFWLPVALESRFVKLGDVITSEHTTFIEALASPFGATYHQRRPDYPFTPSGPLDLHAAYHYTSGWPLKLPWAQAIPPLLALALLVRAGRRGTRGTIRTFALAALVVSAVAWWLTTTASEFVWDNTPPLQWFQFPFRFFGSLGFGLALLAGCGAAALPRRAALRGPVLVLALGLLAANALGVRDDHIRDVAPERVSSAKLRSFDQFSGFLGSTAGEEYMPRTVQVDRYSSVDRRVGLFETLYPETSWAAGLLLPYAGETSFQEIDAGGQEVRARVTTGPAGGAVALRQLDFPGWTTYLDGRVVEHRPMPYREDVHASLGFIVLDVPPGSHELAFAFETTPARTAGQLISALSVAVLLVASAAVVRRGAARPALAAGGWLLLATAAGLVIYTAGSLVDQWQRRAAPGRSHVPLRPALVANLAAQVQEGRAAVESPSGAQLGPNRFVDLRWLQLGESEAPGFHGGRLRRWLYLHPPSRVSFQLTVPANAALQAGLALDPATWNTEEGDGVRFIAEARDADGGPGAATVVLLDQHLNPRAKTEERGWNDVTVDLSAFAGRRIVLTLRTDPAENLAFDWAGWGNPVVVSRFSARWK